jgi:copper chaperone CopZ
LKKAWNILEKQLKSRAYLKEEISMKKTFKLENLGCANCAAKMENAICKLEGVTDATVNFMTTKMVIEADDDKIDQIIPEAEKIVKKIEPYVVVKKA